MKKLHGEAAFAKKSDLERKKLIYKPGAYGKDKNYKHPPVLLGKIGDKFIADYSQLYTSFAAAPGAGKGVGFVIPNLLQYPESCVVNDPKLENWEITAGYRESVLGQKCFLFSPDAEASSGYLSHCWNPLDYVDQSPREMLSSIKIITSILIPTPSGENQSFFISAQDLVNGIIMYLMETEGEARTMTRVLQIIRHPDGLEAFIQDMVQSRQKSGKPLSDSCKELLLSFANNENPRGRDSTKGIAGTYLSVFDAEVVSKATSKSDFDFRDLRKRKMTIYVGVRPPSMGKFQRLLNLFFSQCIIVNTQTLPESAPKDDPLPYQCLMLIDEFPALGTIDIIRVSSGYTRGYNMRYALIFQNKSQLAAKESYGPEGSGALLETMHNQIVLGGVSTKEAEGYSKDIGDITLRNRPVSKNSGKGGGSRSVSDWQFHKRPLMLPQEITNMPDKKCLIFKKGVLPIHADKIFWYKEKMFKDRANMKLPQVPPLFD
ncbi:type IV secretory system conjugative DNA transfer family protein [Halomonas sp. 3D7M]|uniref:type IV secretory system conjugative DNA transfer family protein n=1 Tax=Halomonas sp. 3D7M TaxID=2742617 RepID=UPI00406BF728